MAHVFVLYYGFKYYDNGMFLKDIQVDFQKVFWQISSHIPTFIRISTVNVKAIGRPGKLHRRLYYRKIACIWHVVCLTDRCLRNLVLPGFNRKATRNLSNFPLLDWEMFKQLLATPKLHEPLHMQRYKTSSAVF